MASPGNDFAAGAALFNNVWKSAQDAKYRKEEAEWTKYTRDRKKAEDAQFDAGKAAALAELEREDDGVDVGETLGLRMPGTKRPAVQAKPGESDMANASAGLSGPSVPQIEEPGAGIKLQRGAQYGRDKGMLRQLAAMAKDPAQLEALLQSARKLKMDSDTAAISDRVLKATPEEATRWAQAVTADKRNGFKAAIDPKNPGLMRIEEGDTAVSLDRTQMAKFLSATYRLKQGDRSALADLEGIDKGLAEKLDKTYSRARDEVDDARKAFETADTAKYRAGMLKNDEVRLGLMRSTYGAKGKDADPALIQENNRLYAAMQEEPDPAKRRELERAFRANQVRIANSMNKVLSPTAGREEPELKVNPDGSVISGGMLYLPDPAKPGSFIPARGLQPSALDRAIAASQNQGPAGLAAQGVPGRPMYNASTADLQRMASKPRGVSSEEARDAAMELQMRRGESRMSGF